MIAIPTAASARDALGLPVDGRAGSDRDAVVLVDALQRIVAANASALQMFGYSVDALLGLALTELVPASQRSALAQRLQAFVDSGANEQAAKVDAPIRGLRADGQDFPVEASLSRIELQLDGRRQSYCLAMLRDLSVEPALRAVLDLAPVAMWIVEHQRVAYANRAAAALFGVPDPGQLVGQPIQALLQDSAAAALAATLDQALQGGATVQVAATIKRPDGQLRHVEVATTALPDHGSSVLQMVIIDMTQQLAQAQEQALHRFELRRLAASVVEAREEERRRISRELHDELGQRLTALKLALAGLRGDCSRSGASPPADADPRFADMLEMIDNTVAALRRIATDLRPLMLDDLGLYAAIEWLARDAARRMDIEVTLRLDAEDPPALAPGADIALYRMVQEALTNVGRHAKATDVRIGLQRDGDTLVLTVHDNGKGFPAQAMAHENRYGLLGIRERAFMLGGRLEVDNPPGGGGRITVRLPLQARPQQAAHAP